MLQRERMEMLKEDELAHSIRNKQKLLKEVLGSEKAQQIEKDQNAKGNSERFDKLA